jgi:hypothetical protein
MMLIFLNVSEYAIAQEASEALSCREVQGELQKPVITEITDKSHRKKSSKAAPEQPKHFTGWCRADIRFEDAPAPGDVVTILDDARPFLDNCALVHKQEKLNLLIEVGVGTPINDRDYRNSVNVTQSVTYGVETRERDSYHRQAQGCIATALRTLKFPEPYPYTFTWHYVYPLDIDLLVGPPEPLPIPSVNRGNFEISGAP